MDDKNFFPGPFNPKYKDLNLWDKEYIIPIKNFNETIIDRNIDRTKQKNIIKKYNKISINDRKEFTNILYKIKYNF
jgi:hypothetical protein